MILLIMIVVLALVAAFYFLFRWLLYELAQDNILFTLRTEGEIKAIMKGDTCVRYVMEVENYLIDPDGFDVFKGSVHNLRHYTLDLLETHKLKKSRDSDGTPTKAYDPAFVEKKLQTHKVRRDDGSEKEEPIDPPVLRQEFENRLRRANERSWEDWKSWFELCFGVVWVGFPPYHVFEYPFRWIKYTRQDAEEGDTSPEAIKYRMIPRTDTVDSLYFRYPAYGLQIDDAETGAGSLGRGGAGGKTAVLEKVQVILDIVFETVTDNPQKTLFRSTGLSSAGDWIIAVAAEIRDQIRPFVARRSYEELIEIKDQSNQPESGNGGKGHDPVLVALQTEVIDRINAKIIRDYGQHIDRLRIVNVDLKDPEIKRETAAYFKAKQKADAAEQKKRERMTLADATEREAAAPLLGKAKGYKAIMEAGGGNIIISEELGKLRGVYAPGKDGIFINVAGVTAGQQDQPEPAQLPPGGEPPDETSS